MDRDGVCGVYTEMELTVDKEMPEFRVRGTGSTDETCQVSILPVGIKRGMLVTLLFERITIFVISEKGGVKIVCCWLGCLDLTPCAVFLAVVTLMH